jgi:polysaccharide export outer membrane protein
VKSRLLLAALFTLAVSSAQTAVATDSELQLSRKQLRSASDDAIKEFEAPAMGAYTLDGGDQISIDVWGRSELSGKHIIGPDGEVTLPIAGAIDLLGKTREEAEAAITKALLRYYSDLAVTVRVEQYASFRVLVLGRVGAPGALNFDRQPTLLDALTKAVGLPVGGNAADSAGLVRCAVFRGRNKALWIDLKPLLGQGRLDLNIRLARNDVIYLPDAADRLVYVLGYVRTPGAVHLTPTMSLLDALALAGGPTEDAAVEHMNFIRPSLDKQIEVPMQTLLKGAGKLNYSLEEGDILYVPQRGLARFGYVLQKFSPLTGFAVFGSLAKP